MALIEMGLKRKNKNVFHVHVFMYMLEKPPNYTSFYSSIQVLLKKYQFHF